MIEPAVEAKARASPDALLRALTREVVGYLLAGLAGAFLRFWALGGMPLTPVEGERALAAWRFIQGGMPAVWREPLLHQLTGLGFFFFGPDDSVARLVPALAGCALIFVPWLFRADLGRAGALAAAGLIALSPALTVASRTLSDSVLAALLLLLFARLMLADDDVRAEGWRQWPRPLYLGGVALALLLSLGAAGFTACLLLVGYSALRAGFGQFPPVLGQAVRELRTQPGRLTVWLVALWVALLVASTGLLVPSRGGFGTQAVRAWLDEFNVQHGNPGWVYHLQLIALHESVLLLGGLAALLAVAWRLWTRRRVPSLIIFLVWIAVGGTILAAAAGRKSPEQLTLIVAALALLCGWVVGQALGQLDWDRLRRRWWVGLPVLVGLVFLGLALTAVSNNAQLQAALQPAAGWGALDAASVAIVALIGLPLALALTTLVAVLLVTRDARLIAPWLLGAGLLLVLLGARNAWLAGAGHTGREWLQPMVMESDLRQGLDNLRWLGRQDARASAPVRVSAELRPYLDWYLRDRRVLTYDPQRPEANAPTELALATIVAQDSQTGSVAPPEGQLVEPVVIARQWTEPSLTMVQWWRWFAFRDALTPPSVTSALFYFSPAP